MSRQVKRVNISGKEDKSNKVTSWSNTTTDTNYPSEKLVKDSLDGKANSTHNHTKSQITDFPTSMTPTSHTHGNLQNNGQVGSTAQASKNVVTDSSGKITTEDKPTIPSASSTTPSADTTNGSVGTGTTWARSNHTHPKSSLYAESSHNHTKSQITDFPSIPSKTSDLQNDSGFLTSHQDISGKIDTAGTGLSKSGTTLNHSNSITALTTASFKKVKYDSQGHITGTSDVSASDLPTHTHSQYLTEHQDLSNYVTTDDSRLSDARTPTSHTHTQSQITDFPTLPTASSTVPSADTQNGSYGSGTSYARSNHTHPKSSIYAESSHTHSQYLTSHQDITGKENTSNKVTSISSSSTDTEYPSAKCVFDKLNGYLTSNEEVIFVNGTNQSTDTTTNTFTGTTSKLDSINSVVDGTKLIYKVSVTSTNDTNDLRLSLGTNSGVVERYIKSDNTYTTANLYPTYTLLFLVFFNGAWHIIGQSNPKLKNRIVDLVYPIGSIYMSVNATSPATLFGGTWEQIEDTFLLASGSTYSAGSTGGSADATLVSHQHGTNTSGEYFVTSENSDANNTRVTYSSSGNRYVDGMNASTTPFHHRVGTGYVGSSGTGKNMPPYLAVYMWKRTA